MNENEPGERVSESDAAEALERRANAQVGAIDPAVMLDLPPDEALEAGDFSSQRTIADPAQAAGPGTSDPEDLASEGDMVYSPATDPVLTTDETGAAKVLGGWASSSMESLEVAPSALDGRPGDEALAEAVRRELREDAATTGLDLRVSVEGAVAHLHGTVQLLDDAQNAEEVASRVPGIVEVQEHLEVEGL